MCVKVNIILETKIWVQHTNDTVPDVIELLLECLGGQDVPTEFILDSRISSAGMFQILSNVRSHKL